MAYRSVRSQVLGWQDVLGPGAALTNLEGPYLHIVLHWAAVILVICFFCIWTSPTSANPPAPVTHTTAFDALWVLGLEGLKERWRRKLSKNTDNKNAWPQVAVDRQPP